MPRNLVLFDLEWNIGYQPYTFNYHGVQQTFRGEIVEIGAVKIDEDANVLDTFSIHLRPRIFRKLQHHIAKVTGLTQADLDRGEPIVQGLRRFMQWCGPDAEFAEWGMDDVPVLKQNLFLCNIDESKPTVWYDLQQVFLREHPRREGEGMTLESVVTRMGIPMERQFHDALSDTLYTADVGSFFRNVYLDIGDGVGIKGHRDSHGTHTGGRGTISTRRIQTSCAGGAAGSIAGSQTGSGDTAHGCCGCDLQKSFTGDLFHDNSFLFLLYPSYRQNLIAVLVKSITFICKEKEVITSV